MREALRVDPSHIRIICPFIKMDAIEMLLSLQSSSIQVITRFNLADFSEGVSDVAALRGLLGANASVRGVRNLHAKLYLFGNSRAIITSANLTVAALNRNHEFGMVAESPEIIQQCRAYFDSLWKRAGNDLHNGQIEEWDKKVSRHRLQGGHPDKTASLGDYGVDAGISSSPLSGVPDVFADASQAFVKLLGLSTADGRVPLSYPTLEEVREGECHWAVCYSKRPLQVRDDAVVFMGRLTRDPNDIRVFGRAIGMAYSPGRDDATADDIARCPWKAQWSRYIRVRHAEFVAGTVKNGISFDGMMDSLKSDSFASTQRNASLGKGNVNPRRAYLQQPAVALSDKGLSWLNGRLEAAFETYGKIPRDSLDTLGWPNP